MKSHKILLVIAVIAVTVLGNMNSWSQTNPPVRPLRPFMQQKVDYAAGILEALTLENYHRAITNAFQLRNMTPTNGSPSLMISVNYRAALTNFQNSVDELITAARSRDLDKTTDAFANVSRSCVECHKVFRREQFIRHQSEDQKRR